jgi:hypothetical protein
MFPPPINAPITVNVHERTLTSSYGQVIEDIAPRLTSYEQSIADTVGFESCTLRLLVTLEEANEWCERLLCGVRCWGPDADAAWEGFIHTATYVAGGETVSYSLGTVANRITVAYPLTGLGTPQRAGPVTNTTSTALYGVHDLVATTGATNSTAATAMANALLNERALPAPNQDGTLTIAGGGAGQQLVELTLLCQGWYATLDWVVTTRADTSTEATTTQVGALIGTSSPGIGATNAFLSTSTARITASGLSDTREIAQDTPYRAKIEALLAKGNSSNQRFAWGVYEDRVFVVDVWAGATPSTITYRQQQGEAYLETGVGLITPPWRVRPNAMVETVGLLPVGPPSGAIATPGRRYVSRVVCSIDSGGIALRLEPSQANSTDAMLARLGG